MSTQLIYARRGEQTPQMQEVAREESIPPDVLVGAIAAGKVVVPINRKRLDACRPVGIGAGLRTKVNANIGTSPGRSSLDEELHKLETALRAGADAIMDLSIGDGIDETRRRILQACDRPLGTVPIYQTIADAGNSESIGIDGFLDVLRRHGEDGVDFVTIHAGITRDALPLLDRRLMGVVSRGGALLVSWMRRSGRENFLFSHYDEILAVAAHYDLTLSLGDGLRPGCIDDATDEAQLHELRVLGELAARARDAGVQVMIEGPGHVPIWQIRENVRLQKEYCDGAPFYVLGPLPTDIAAGYDHFAGAVGGAIAAGAGADFLCYLTPREHIGLPDAEDVREGVILARIAAHIGDLEKKVPGAAEQDRNMSLARAQRDWDAMARYAIDPERYRRLIASEDRSDKCSMCGELCAVKVYRESMGKGCSNPGMRGFVK